MKLAAALLLFGLAFATLGLARDLPVSGGSIDVQYATPPAPELEKAVTGWIGDAARAIHTYYGFFPPRQAVLRITAQGGHQVESGEASGWNGPLIKVVLGRNTRASDLADAWELPHEMLHLCFPDLAERHHWLEEGMATYVEPVARARAGLLSPQRVWGDLVEQLPLGQPQAGDRGLDHTPTWGRTYHGGALFCLRADLEARRRTGNRRGLEHALRAIAAAGGTIEHTWKIERVIAVGDAAIGEPVLRELYEQTKDRPAPVDLPALWRQLGVSKIGPVVTFDDRAPLAAIRKAITER